MLPKEVKNGHIAESKNPVKPEESDCKAFCDFDDSFHDFCPFSGGLAAARRRVGDLSVFEHLLTVFEVKAAPAFGFIVAALHQELK